LLLMAENNVSDLRTATPQQAAAIKRGLIEARQRYSVADADAARLRRAPSESEADAEAYLATTKTAIERLYQDFPNPADRDMYVGFMNRPTAEVLQYFRADKRFNDFVNDVAALQPEKFDKVKGGFMENEIHGL